MEDRWSRDSIVAQCCGRRGRRGGRGRGVGALGLGWDDIAGADDQRPGPQRGLHQDPQEGRLAGLRRRRRGAGLRPDPGPLRRGRRHVRPHRVRPADHHHWPTATGRPTWPSRSCPTPPTPRGPITLRPNLVFHDGTPCNGAALLTNFAGPVQVAADRHRPQPDAGRRSPRPARWPPPSPSRQPWVPFPYYLAGGIGGQIAYIAAPSMLANPNGTSHPVGTGPFVFKEWIPNDHFTATANPNYWRKGMPYLSQITYKPIPDESARAEALKSGTIDLMITDTPQIITQFRGNKSYSYIDDSTHVAGEPDMNCVQLNCLAKPFNDPNVRQAAAMAVNRQPVRQGHRRGRPAGEQRPLRPGLALLLDHQVPGLQPDARRPSWSRRPPRPTAGRSPSPTARPTRRPPSGPPSTWSRRGRRSASRSRPTSSSRTRPSTTRWPASTRPWAGASSVRSTPTSTTSSGARPRSARGPCPSTWPATPTRPSRRRS